MFKKSIATVLVAGLLAGGTTNTAQAEVSGEELAAIILGGALIYSIAKNRTEKRSRVTTLPNKVITDPEIYSHRHGSYGLHTHQANRAHKHKKAEALPLPAACKSNARIRGKTRTVYRQRCLERNGYRITNNGTVRHHRWVGRTARPILVYR